MKIYSITLLWVICSLNTLYAQIPVENRHRGVLVNTKGELDPRSDSVDILQYTIDLRIRNFVSKQIAGNTTVSFRAKIAVQEIRLDLLELIVDSLQYNGVKIPFQYNDTLLRVRLPNQINTSDTQTVKVFYRGNPQGDPTGWGGFYFSGDYAYNLGVGFGANPHVYGRVWFPCFDNFTERSKFKFTIRTDSVKAAYCNGLLQSDVVLQGERSRTWYMKDEIPSYLASVAIGNYIDLKSTYAGKEKNIPVLIASLANDTNNVKTAFRNLHNAIGFYEQSFGAYAWDRVGYALVPFLNGAMEHATNIAYPRNFSLQGSTYETILMHELSHHWFGNLVTCSSQEDMWLNEGWASYCESLFLEKQYGINSYKTNIRNTHAGLLLNLIYTEGLRSMDSIPFELTYGNYVYLKGAMIAHSLRGYLGDSLFFNGLTAFLAQNKFKAISSEDFQIGLSASTGYNLAPFFNDWVSQPGWADFEVDTFATSGSVGNYSVSLAVQQKIYAAKHLYSEVPLQISFISENFQREDHRIVMSGNAMNFQLPCSFIPKLVLIDLDEKLALGGISQSTMIRSAGVFNQNAARMNVTVTALTDSAFLHVRHHYTAPDDANASQMGMRISPTRYWVVGQVARGSYTSNAKIFYDGRTNNSQLDFALDINHEDSLTLLYRPQGSGNWQVYPHYRKETGSNKTDRYGFFIVDRLMSGQYCFAMAAPIATIVQNKKIAASNVQLYPNPSNNFLVIECNEGDENLLQSYSIIDNSGKLVLEGVFSNKHNEKINLQTLPSSSYLINIQTAQGKITKKFTVKR